MAKHEDEDFEEFFEEAHDLVHEEEELDELELAREAFDAVHDFNALVRELEARGAEVSVEIRPRGGRDRVEVAVKVSTAR